MARPDAQAPLQVPAAGNASPTLDPLPDLDAVTRTEARMMRDLVGMMSEVRQTAGRSLARAQTVLQNLEGRIDPGVSGPHLEGCGLLSVRLVEAYDRGLRSVSRHRREIAEGVRQTHSDNRPK